MFPFFIFNLIYFLRKAIEDIQKWAPGENNGPRRERGTLLITVPLPKNTNSKQKGRPFIPSRTILGDAMLIFRRTNYKFSLCRKMFTFAISDRFAILSSAISGALCERCMCHKISFECIFGCDNYFSK